MMFDVAMPLWIYPLLVWTLVWKGFGSWRSARNGQLIWFISFFIFNTAGILPIVYILWFQRDRNKRISEGKKSGTRKGKRGRKPKKKE